MDEYFNLTLVVENRGTTTLADKTCHGEDVSLDENMSSLKGYVRQFNDNECGSGPAEGG